MGYICFNKFFAKAWLVTNSKRSRKRNRYWIMGDVEV